MEARRTRQNRYFTMSDGSVKAVRRQEIRNDLMVTEYSFVLSHPVEYKKNRAARSTHPKCNGKKTTPKKKATKKQATKKKATKKTPKDRASANVPAMNTDGPTCSSEQYAREYRTIDLETSSVPKPIVVDTKERMGK